MTNNDELALKSEERIKAIANGAQMLMGESRQLAAAALYWKEQARIATDAFQQSGIMQVKAEDKIEVLLAERDADKKRIAELEREKETMTAAALAMRDDMRDARSLLEARTVSVKLPESVIDAICLTAAEIHNLGRGVSDERAQDIIDSIRCAAGIKLEVEEV